MLVAVLGEKLAAVCSEVLPAAAVEWLRGKGFDLIEVSAEQAFTLGVNAISLGDERVISGTGAVELNAALRDRGLEVIELDLSMFTLGGGGPHCMSQALRRERVG